MDRLKREANPPVGQLASPKPQYKDTVLNDWAELQGEGGASYVKDKDALAKLEQARVLLSGVATETKLEEARALLESVAGKDFATQATLTQVQNELALVKTELATIKTNQLSGDQKVQLSGNKPVVIQTVINAQSVAPGSTTHYNSGAFTADGARRLFFAISIDKQPWTAYVMGALSTSDTTVALYPRLSGVNKTFGVNYPRYTTLIVPLEPPDLSEGMITDIGVVQCAYDGVIRIANNSQETATVTVRIIKIF